MFLILMLKQNCMAEVMLGVEDHKLSWSCSKEAQFCRMLHLFVTQFQNCVTFSHSTNLMSNVFYSRIKHAYEIPLTCRHENFGCN